MKEIKIVPKYKLFNYLADQIPKYVDKAQTIRVIDVGCGTKPYENIIREKLKNKAKKVLYEGIDFYGSKADIKLDINNKPLPYKDNSIDIVICTEVLEHVYKPFFVLEEMKRVLKKGGLLVITSPFFFPIHEEQHDYFRYTHNFYRVYFKESKILEEVCSNTFLSFPIYLTNYYLAFMFRTKYKLSGILQRPLDWMVLKFFKNKIVTYSYYMDLGYIIRVKK